MKPLHVFRVCCPLVLQIIVCGCGGPEKAPVLKESASTAAKIEKLPELGDTMPPLDDGRIELAPPKGWHVPPRSNQWMVRFTPSKSSSYPGIFLTAEEYENFHSVSKDNVDAFARQIAAALKEDPKTARLSRDVEPVQIGSLVGITYGRRGKTQDRFKEIVVERLFVETVAGGRKYNVELRTRTGNLEKYRPYLLAVAGGIKFIDVAKAEGTGNESIEK